MSRAAHQSADTVRLKRLGIDTYQEPVIFLSRESPVCRAEGWTAQSRIAVSRNGDRIIATLNMVTEALLAPDEAALSEIAWSHLGAEDGDFVHLSHAPPVESLSAVRAKAYGQRVDSAAIDGIIRDIVAGLYSDIDLAAFVTAFAGANATVDEAIAMARAMVDTGERLYWGHAPIVDKHCVGGLPGNRTSIIVVPVVASLAKAYCSDAYFHAAAENIQIHGGIGFTWEHDAHLYFKRAKSSEIFLGDATYHRELLAQRIGI